MFSVQTDADRRRESHANVRACELFTGETPVPKGPYDPHMGSTDPRYSCASCGLSSKQCAGHAGHVDLPYPVVLPYAVPEIRRWLRVACLSCGAIVVDLSGIRGRRILGMHPSMRLAHATTINSENVACPNCGVTHPKVVKYDKDKFSFQLETPWLRGPGARAPEPQLLYGYQVLAALERISDASVALMGRNPAAASPRDLLVRVLQVPPVSIRPGIRMAGPAGHGASCHDINSILQYIIKSATTAPAFDWERAGARPPPANVADAMTGLQQLVFDLSYGASATSTQRSGRRGVVVGGRPAVSVGRRWAGKGGRLRRNCLGTRVWSICRNTISGNCKIPPGHVAIPEAFARALQIEEVVQPSNITYLMQFFLNGRRQYPGASRVRRAATQTLHDVEGLLRAGQMLEVGDRLWRDVITGDYGMFNRQPSLTRSAIGAHRVIVLHSTTAGDSSGRPEPPEQKSTQFNVIDAVYYGADFDGDEMMLFPLAQPGPRAECLVLASIPEAFTSTKNSSPVVGMVQDSVVGACLLSLTPRMCKLYAMSLFANSGVPPPDFAHMLPADTMSGREAISMLLARAPISLTRRPSWYSDLALPYMSFEPAEALTRIHRGRLTSGVLDKACVGGGAGGGVFHKIARAYSPHEAIRVITALQQMTINLLDQRGFTVSFADMVMPDAANAEIQAIIDGMMREAAAVTERLVNGQIVPPLGMTTHDFYELLQREALKTPDEILGPIYSNMDKTTNGLYQMVASGSKGNPKNVINVSACVGQIVVRDRRIEAHGGGTGRTLAYYQRGDTSPEASGFVPGCYTAGLTAAGHYMGSMIGRNDLTNKALTTAVTGHENRKSIMALQSMVVGPLREVWGPGVAQPLYGDDGMDARQIEPVAFATAALGDAELRAAFAVAGLGGAAWHAAEVAQLVADRDGFRRVFLRLEDSGFSDLMPASVPLAANVASIAADICGAGADSGRPAPAPADLEAMHAMVREFCAGLVYLLLNPHQAAARAAAPAHMVAATEMLRRVVRVELSSQRLAAMRATPALLLAVFDAVRMRFLRSLVSPGEAVGILASQAVSEPLTQYMLDSHHRSVSGGTSKSSIVRPHEIFSARAVREEKSPEMLIRCLGADGARTNDRAALQRLADSIKTLTLAQVTARWDILFEPYIGGGGGGDDAHFPAHAGDRAWVDAFARSNPLIATPGDLSYWCMRVALSRIGLMMKSITLEDLVSRLRMMCPFAHIVHSPEAYTDQFPDPVMRVYLRTGIFGKSPMSSTVPSTAMRNAIKTASAQIPAGTRSAAERLAEAVFAGISSAPLRGVAGISDARVEKVTRHCVDGEGRVARRADEYAIRTSGTNLAGVLMYEAVDAASAVTSSIGDTIGVLGIEAGRERIIKEIGRVMSSKSPNARHLQVYADQMTRTGTYTSLEYGGVRRREPSNVLLRAATHGPLGVLTQAPLNNTKNVLYGMAAPMLMGGIPRLGTGTVELIINQEFVRANRKSIYRVLDDL